MLVCYLTKVSSLQLSYRRLETRVWVDRCDMPSCLTNTFIPDYSFYRLLERKTQMDFTGANVEIAPGMCLVIWYQRSKLMMSGW